MDSGVDLSRMQQVKWILNPPPGFDLVRRLNAQPDSEPTKRLSALILKVKRLQDLERTHRRTLVFSPTKGLISSKRKANADRHRTRLDRYEFWGWPEQHLQRYGAVFAEINRLNMQIKTELDQFSFFPRLHVSAFATQVGWIPPAEHRGKAVYEMVAALLCLAENDGLGWIGQCEKCGRWFCARRPGYQKFCGVACQQTQYKSSPEWKAHRAQYMRRYRKVTGAGGR